MSRERTIFYLTLAVLVSTTVGCAATKYEKGSLLCMQDQQQQRLYRRCMHVQVERNMLLISDMGTLSSSCHEWAHRRLLNHFSGS